ncbi:hypothetical protein JCM9279_005840 [Rhodotorula babjevae]
MASAQPETPPSESLLAVAHSLRATLSSLDSSSQQHHALGQVPPAAIPYLKQRTHDSIHQLRAGLAALSNLALPSSTSTSITADGAPAQAPPPRQPDPRERDKLLTLLRDAALAEQPLLDARTASLAALSHLRRRAHSSSRALFPARTPAPGSGATAILDTLERVAADLGLVHLRDDPALEAGADQAGPVVLSLGGKLMAVDVELSPSTSSTEGAPAQRVERTKVAYVVAGHDAQCPAASDKLHALLAVPSTADADADAAQVQVRWRGVRTLLEELQELDEATERTGDDCFARVTRELPDELAQALPRPADGPLDSSTSLRLLPSPSSLHPRLIYHSPPLPPPSSPTSAAADGTYTATISLSAIVDAPLAGHGGSVPDPARPYVALLSPAVSLSRCTARKVCEALGLGLEGAPSGDEEAQGEREHDDGEDVEGWVGALLGAPGGLERARAEANTVTHPDCPPLSFTLALPPPRFAPSSSIAPSAPSPAPAPAPRLVATHLRFAHAAQLVAALRILDAQVRANALVRSAVEPRGPSGARAGAEAAARPAKRARAQGGKKGGMTLDELFAPLSPDAPPPPLPVSVHPTSSPLGPGATLTVPLPIPSSSSALTSTSPSSYAAALVGAPIALELVCPYAAEAGAPPHFKATLHLPPALKLAALSPSSASGGAQVGEGAEGEERERAARARLERRLERVAQVAGGDAGLVVREVLSRVGAAMEMGRKSEERGEGGA